MTSPLMELRDVEVKYKHHAGLGQHEFTAVKGLSLSIAAGDGVAIVGESGAGKSSVARCMAGLQLPTGGELLFEQRRLDVRRNRQQRRRIQMVFQDPYSSLNPRRKVGSVLTELLRVHRVATGDAADRHAGELLEMVGLSADHLECRPRALSGGQRQRVGIARALALEPELLIADEPVSALDVSVQASVLGLISDLRRQLGLTLVLISHDLGVVRELCERVVVMRRGEVVEEGATAEVFTSPQHPYTVELLAANIHLPAVVDVFGSGDRAVAACEPTSAR